MPLPAVVESSLVVVVELRPGVRVAASWTGRGLYVTLHAQAGTGQAIALGYAAATAQGWSLRGFTRKTLARIWGWCPLRICLFATA